MALHPQAKQLLEAFAAQNAPSWDQMAPERGRALFAEVTELFGAAAKKQDVDDRTLAEVPVRVYVPAATAPLPVVVYFHGGGWVLGDVQTHDALCRRLSEDSSSVVVSVDYRRAPEHRYPAALDDCYAVTRHVAEHAEQFGAQAQRLVVAGDSAGGNLAAAVALKARDTGVPPIRGQLLIVPVIEPRFDTASYRDFAEGYGLTQTTMNWFWRQYLGDDLTLADAYAAPSLADSLEGLPPAHVVTAEYDVLRDEGEHFAARLVEAGVPTTLKRYDGMIHGFIHFSGALDVGRRAMTELAAAVRRLAGD